ncbi:MAG: PASTA domain-containing protein [Rikenellaceae bacterium]
MSNIDNLSWLKKREESDGIEGNKGKKGRGEKGADGLRKRDLLLRLSIHGVAIICFVLIISVVAHFILRSVTHHGVERVVPQFEMTNIHLANFNASKNDLNIVVNDSIFAPNLPGGTVLEQLPKSGTIVKPGRSIYVTISAMQQAMVEMPYVAGRSLRQAKNMLDGASVSIKKLEYTPDIATNYVIAQYYDEHEVKEDVRLMVPSGAEVTLIVGVAEGADSTLVPRVLGLSLNSARNNILNAGFNMGIIRYDSDESRNDFYNARILYQGLEYGTRDRVGNMISLTLSSDPKVVSRSILEIEQERRYREMLQMERDSLERVAHERGLSVDMLMMSVDEEIIDEDDEWFNIDL